MQFLTEAVKYFLSFQPYVMLPIIIFILAIIFRVKVAEAVKSSLTLGIAFVGIFMTFDFFVKTVSPAMTSLIERTGLDMPVLDTGWPPLAAIAWSNDFAPVLLVMFLIINMILLVTKVTKTVNIDIWNFWHVIILAATIHFITGSIWITFALSAVSYIVVLKLADWSAHNIKELNGMDGVSIPHLSAQAHFPIAVAGNKILDLIPGMDKLHANPEHIRKKLGLLGEPMILGIIMGVALGIGAGYELKELLNLSIRIAAVVFILPKMGTILGSALLPISEGMKLFIKKKLPKLGKTYIGLDVAILFGNPSVIVTALLLMPVSVLLAIFLPGINFIPLGDLTNLLVPIGIISIVTKGNIIKSFILGIPVVIINLYYASAYAPIFTDMAKAVNYQIEGYDGVFTSFLDAGNPYRSWLVNLLDKDLLSIILIPVVLLMFFITWRSSKKEELKLNSES